MDVTLDNVDFDKIYEIPVTDEDLGTPGEVETESKELLSSNTSLSFKLKNGHFVNIYINKR